MKKTFKLILALLAVSVLLCAGAVSASADDYAFSVYDKDGKLLTELSGANEADLHKASSLLPDGSTIVFNKDIEITKCFSVESTEENPRTVNIDLNGNMLYSMVKINMIAACKYTTLNVYSSRAGAEIYVTQADNPVYGGNIFFLRGKASAMNVGEVEINGVVYPGTNLSTYSTALVDVAQGNYMCEESVFNINGGSYFSIQSDYSGFIIPRCGEIVMNIKNANVIMLEDRAPINSAGYSTVLNMENCLLVHYEAKPAKLFNNANGQINMKDCITTYSIDYGTTYAPGALTLEGKNTFSASAGFVPEILSGEGYLLGNTYAECELIEGGTVYQYYNANGNLNPMKAILSSLKEIYTPIKEEDKVKYTFVYNGETQEQFWSKYDKVVFPIETPTDTQEGVYKYGWLKSYDEDGNLVYTLERTGDFGIKVSLRKSKNSLCFYIYAPGHLVKDGALDFAAVTIAGVEYSRFDWEEVELNGETYYRTITPELEADDINKKIEVYIPCDFGNNIYTKSVWNITLSDYIDAVLDTESEGKYTKEDYDFVRSVKNEFFKTEEAPVAMITKKEII